MFKSLICLQERNVSVEGSSSSGPGAYAPDAPHPIGLLCDPYPLVILDVPTSALRRERSYQRKVELWARMLAGNFAYMSNSTLHLGIFYMPQICDMGPTTLLPLRRKACWGFFRPEKSWRLRPEWNPRTWLLKGSTLPLDHRSRYKCGGLPCLPVVSIFWLMQRTSK